MPTHDTTSQEKIAGVSITISREHQDFEKDISECFNDKFITESNLMRFSDAPLHMQVIIDLSKWVSLNIAWEIIKIGLKKFYEKFPKAHVTITHKGIMYAIGIDGSVKPVVYNQPEYAHIRTTDDLIRHIESTSETKNNTESKWRDTTLGEVSDFISRGVTPKYSEIGIRVYNQKCIRDGNVLLKDSRFLDENQGIMNGKILKDYDILICSTGVGTLGRVGQLKEVKEKSTVDTHITIVRINDTNSKKFFGYLLKSKEKFIESLAEGSTGQTELPREKVRNIPIFLPPLHEQQAIADILSSLDAKIEHLREQNIVLEGTAQTLFQEWFGKYGVEDELPEEWRVGKLGEVTNIKGGSTPSTQNSSFWGGNIAWTSPKDLSNSKELFLLETESKITNEGLRQVSSGLLPKGTLLLSSRAPIGYLAITQIDVAINQGYMAFLEGNYFSNKFMFLWLRKNMQTVLNTANGSTFLEISKSAFRTIECIVPKEETLKQFDVIIEPLFDKILSNLLHIRSLSKTRDEILPRLVNGELRVTV